MLISNLEHVEPLTSELVVCPAERIKGGRLVYTEANASARNGAAGVRVVAAAVGSYTSTYTSSRTSVRVSVRNTRSRSLSRALGNAHATARLGNQTDMSGSVDYDSHYG
ncbi:MAG: hypothetical protein AAF152_11230 [Cyanobacteria bacterium P01_A01_bin.114]